MKNVIWGIGYYGRACAINIGLKNVAFFIDSKEYKRESFWGKKVINPEDVVEWDSLHIYIPYTYQNEVEEQLEQRGINLKNITVYSENAQISEEVAESEFRRAINEAREIDLKDYNGGVAFWARMWSANREHYKGWIRLIESINMLVISEAYWINQNETERRLKKRAIIAPSFSACETVNIKQIKSGEKCSDDSLSDSIIKELMKSIVLANPQITEATAYEEAYKTYSFMDYILRRGKFSYVIICSSDVPEHIMLRSLCERRKIKTLFTHPSVLPGTLSYDPSGDFGDSVVSIYNKEFLQLPISQVDCLEAKRVLGYLRESGANRKVQPKNNWRKFVFEKIKPNRPIVFYAGQFDLSSSMIPYTYKSMKYQSPIFKSTFDAAIYLSEICEKNDWNFIYKPHPMYQGRGKGGLPPSVIYVPSGDINEIVDFADVTVTIRSTTNYVALIRENPVLMLGYTQTRGQGCTYEAFVEEDIEPQLKMAIQNGFTNEKKQKFIEHVARLLKYYLYDDMGDRPIRYGLKYPERIEDFFLLKDKLEAMSRQGNINNV